MTQALRAEETAADLEVRKGRGLRGGAKEGGQAEEEATELRKAAHDNDIIFRKLSNL